MERIITEIEQQTIDFDWFFTNTNYISFLASGGGKLPDSVAKSHENLSLLSSYFESLPDISEVIINPELHKLIIPVDERYLESFINMSRKGLFSYDRTVLNVFSNPKYHLVAKPVVPLTIHELPSEIIKILTATKYNGVMPSILNIDFID